MRYQYEPLRDEYEFQTFLKDLFNAKFKTNSFEEYRSKGYAQFGVDLYSPELKIAIQAKKKDINRPKQVLLKELSIDLETTINQIAGFPHQIDLIYFATTTAKYPEIQDACITHNLSGTCNLQFLSWMDIQAEIAQFPSIRNRYYPALEENFTGHLETTMELKKQLARLEELLKSQNATSVTRKKEYRTIPNCEILLPPVDLQSQKFLVAIITKIAAYQTFGDIEYKKFICLLNFSRFYTQFGDGTSGPGFAIISGEVKFLGNCGRLVKMLQNDSEQFWQLYDKLKEDPRFKQINFRMELLPVEGLTAYEFEIDGQTGSYLFKPTEIKPLDYERLDSLNAVLPFVAATTKPWIQLIEFDKLQRFPAFTRLIHALIIEGSFKLSAVRVNVNDFDDWDYFYTGPKN